MQYAVCTYVLIVTRFNLSMYIPRYMNISFHFNKSGNIFLNPLFEKKNSSVVHRKCPHCEANFLVLSTQVMTSRWPHPGNTISRCFIKGALQFLSGINLEGFPNL